MVLRNANGEVGLVPTPPARPPVTPGPMHRDEHYRQRSSMVESATCNRVVVGSIPSAGSINHNHAPSSAITENTK